MKNKSMKVLKRVIKLSPVTRRLAKKVKQKVVDHIEHERSQREIYNLASFYPSIEEYHHQLHSPSSSDDPLISILLPTYNTSEEYLRACIDSIIIQSYPKWELCIADDHSPDERVKEIIKEYAAQDSRIKYTLRAKNGHISESTNSALELATGDYAALMDHDDVLWPNALYEIARVIRENPDVDHVYTDEDKIEETGKIHSYPFLKPDMNPEFLESCNYITHFSCIRTSLLKKLGGLRKGYEGAQDWDLFIRISEVTDKIIHIPKILYSWRIHSLSTASDTDAKPYVYEAQLKLLQDHLKRTKRQGVVETGLIKQHRTIKYDIPTKSKLCVMVFVDSLSDSSALIQSLSDHRAGVNYDVVYLLKKSVSKSDIESIHTRYLPEIKSTYTHSQTIDKAIQDADTEHLLIVKDTMRVASDDWGKLFVAEIQHDEVGFVGPVIMSSQSETILSAGLGIGYGDDRVGYLDMLTGMPFDDQHYTRGLYAKSRRAVTAVNPSVFAVTKSTWVQSKEENTIDRMLEVNNYKKRNLYTPYIRFCTRGLEQASITTPNNYEDSMLNPHFKKDNPRMEVRY